MNWASVWQHLPLPVPRISVRLQRFGILVVTWLAVMTGCAATEPVLRLKAQEALKRLDAEEAPRIQPDAYRSVQESFERGEVSYHQQKDATQADLYYRLVMQKAQVLSVELLDYRRQQAEAARLQQELAERQRRAEEERKRVEAAEEERRREQAARERLSATRSQPTEQPVTVIRERPTSYSVRRGETLPQIAARPEIYNDASLWPLIYRANRDQVRDPYQLWPGQVLKIPRSYSRDEAAEARRQAVRR